MGLVVVEKVRLDLGKSTLPEKTLVEGWRKLWGPPPEEQGRETAVSYLEVRDGARNKHIKGQERRIYCLPKVQSI